MMGNRDSDIRRDAMASPRDLEQIRDAVGALRASCPGSALADLVEEKIRVIERGAPVPRAEPAAQGAAGR